jgi:hypothetical protein
MDAYADAADSTSGFVYSIWFREFSKATAKLVRRIKKEPLT